ncbi:hypothetical protein Tco_1536522 [Tanacetum coccineum]
MTPESIQAMIDQALLRKSTNRDGSHSSHGDNRRNVQTARPCFYADFMKCQPLSFKGTEGVVGAALTWWNGQIRTLGPEAYAMTWEVLKKKMTDKYCPQGEIKKLEIELWNLKGTEGVVGLTRWIEKMESVFNISGCAIENQVKFATCTLLGAALTWWNGQMRTLGPEAYAMT